MKRTPTSFDITACPQLQPAQSCITFIAPETPTPLNFASQSSCFLSVNGTLNAAKLDGKCDEAQMASSDITAYPPLQPAQSCITRTWESPRRCFEATCQLNLAAFYP